MSILRPRKYAHYLIYALSRSNTRVLCGYIKPLSKMFVFSLPLSLYTLHPLFILVRLVFCSGTTAVEFALYWRHKYAHYSNLMRSLGQVQASTYIIYSKCMFLTYLYGPIPRIIIFPHGWHWIRLVRAPQIRALLKMFAFSRSGARVRGCAGGVRTGGPLQQLSPLCADYFAQGRSNGFL